MLQRTRGLLMSFQFQFQSKRFLLASHKQNQHSSSWLFNQPLPLIQSQSQSRLNHSRSLERQREGSISHSRFLRQEETATSPPPWSVSESESASDQHHESSREDEKAWRGSRSKGYKGMVLGATGSLLTSTSTEDSTSSSPSTSTDQIEQSLGSPISLRQSAPPRPPRRVTSIPPLLTHPLPRRSNSSPIFSDLSLEPLSRPRPRRDSQSDSEESEEMNRVPSPYSFTHLDEMNTVVTPPASIPVAPRNPASLGPLAKLDGKYESIKEWRILMLVSAINSFSQRVWAYLDQLGCKNLSMQLALSEEGMIKAAEEFKPDLIICPFLTAKIPPQVHDKWMTWVVHPGPPGDAGPSALDWVLLGDKGDIEDPEEALKQLMTTHRVTGCQRRYWGCILFQADEQFDGGAVWAWDQYILPEIGTVTKAQLYQNEHACSAIKCISVALHRLAEKVNGDIKTDFIRVCPEKEWGQIDITFRQPFLGGTTRERPSLRPNQRRPNFDFHYASEIAAIINSGDSQPGAQLNPLTGDSKSPVFAYGAHVHENPELLPSSYYQRLGYPKLNQVPNGTILATRDGAVLIKTASCTCTSCTHGSAIWITHGRLLKSKDKPLDPKVSMVDALQAAGHGKALEGVEEWEIESFERKRGTWQQVYVETLPTGTALGTVAQLVYWDFYNGAFTTENCKLLLRALQWAVKPERGNVKILALMGGAYFSNGIALNTIEQAQDPGAETWANINAIDDIVEFLLGDTRESRSAFLENKIPLAKRGITTIACVQGNAAAGGVALAASCDVVIGCRGVVLNPAYRAMGLTGSEFHSFSYRWRAREKAARLARDMMPISTSLASRRGLVDIECGDWDSFREFADNDCREIIYYIGRASTKDLDYPRNVFRSAPWCAGKRPELPLPLVKWLCQNKVDIFDLEQRGFPELVLFRNAELSQMLLDSFHPFRSQRYHSRRYKFIRKIKATSSPVRYLHNKVRMGFDTEELKDFDSLGLEEGEKWHRGDEWSFAGLEPPEKVKETRYLLLDLYPKKYQRQIEAFIAGGGAPMTPSSEVSSSDSLHSSLEIGTGVSVSTQSSSGLTASVSNTSSIGPITPAIEGETYPFPSTTSSNSSPTPAKATLPIPTSELSSGSDTKATRYRRRIASLTSSEVNGLGVEAILDEPEWALRLSDPVPIPGNLKSRTSSNSNSNSNYTASASSSATDAAIARKGIITITRTKNGPKITREYAHPQVENAQECDMPCLYNSAGAWAESQSSNSASK